MTLNYRLDRDVVARTATVLNWNLKQVKSSIRIINHDKMVNGKSLVGLLSANIRFNDTIKVIVDEAADVDDVREYFNEIGREI